MTREELIQSTNFERHEYKQVCKNCGKELSLFTQSDNCPEYYTGVKVECECGQMVHFELPVN